MTPKEKAYQLFNKYSDLFIEKEFFKASVHFTNEIVCELVKMIVTEIIDSEPKLPFSERSMKTSKGTDMVMVDYPPILFWNEVNYELERLVLTDKLNCFGDKVVDNVKIGIVKTIYLNEKEAYDFEQENKHRRWYKLNG